MNKHTAPEPMGPDALEAALIEAIASSASASAPVYAAEAHHESKGINPVYWVSFHVAV